MTWSTKKELPWTLFCVGMLLVLAWFLVLRLEPAPRVGDGCEYYLMTMAWTEQFQPYGDSEVDRHYEKYRESRTGSFVPAHDVNQTFPKLKYNDQQDYPHFWFYSLLASPFCWSLDQFGADMAHGFTLLHLCLFGVLLVVSGKYYGRRGIFVATLLCLGSPMLWFLNKAHTEFFTFTVSLCGVIYFLNSRIALSFLAFSIVSTQNPPFGIIAILVLVFGIAKNRRAVLSQPWVLASGVIACSLHPVYYFLRHGNLTPQLITGSASTSFKGLRHLTCFFVDPDVGLLGNWPWVLIPVVAVLVVAVVKKQKFNWYVLSFCFVSLALLAWAQAKTNNFNHGGTIKISRYALWYIPFLLPLLLQFIHNYRIVPPWQRVAVFLFLIVATYFNTTKYQPARPESYVFPSLVAKKLYQYFPEAYDPIPEIFIERCIHSESSKHHWAISNQKGTKIIVHRGRLRKLQNRFRQGKPLEPIVGCEYLLDSALLVEHINNNIQLPDDLGWFYVNSPGDLRAKPGDVELAPETALNPNPRQQRR